uniref:USP domain-containing protein n=1 Tax=Caenorhabditis tropicalis TaxID=1561998 RepID=A0A1I7TRT8_9PELO
MGDRRMKDRLIQENLSLDEANKAICTQSRAYYSLKGYVQRVLVAVSHILVDWKIDHKMEEFLREPPDSSDHFLQEPDRVAISTERLAQLVTHLKKKCFKPDNVGIRLIEKWVEQLTGKSIHPHSTREAIFFFLNTFTAEKRILTQRAYETMSNFINESELKFYQKFKLNKESDHGCLYCGRVIHEKDAKHLELEIDKFAFLLYASPMIRNVMSYAQTIKAYPLDKITICQSHLKDIGVKMKEFMLIKLQHTADVKVFVKWATNFQKGNYLIYGLRLLNIYIDERIDLGPMPPQTCAYCKKEDPDVHYDQIFKLSTHRDCLRTKACKILEMMKCENPLKLEKKSHEELLKAYNILNATFPFIRPRVKGQAKKDPSLVEMKTWLLQLMDRFWHPKYRRGPQTPIENYGLEYYDDSDSDEQLTNKPEAQPQCMYAVHNDYYSQVVTGYNSHHVTSQLKCNTIFAAPVSSSPEHNPFGESSSYEPPKPAPVMKQKPGLPPPLMPPPAVIPWDVLKRQEEEARKALMELEIDRKPLLLPPPPIPPVLPPPNTFSYAEPSRKPAMVKSSKTTSPGASLKFKPPMESFLTPPPKPPAFLPFPSTDSLYFPSTLLPPPPIPPNLDGSTPMPFTVPRPMRPPTEVSNYLPPPPIPPQLPALIKKEPVDDSYTRGVQPSSQRNLAAKQHKAPLQRHHFQPDRVKNENMDRGYDAFSRAPAKYIPNDEPSDTNASFIGFSFSEIASNKKIQKPDPVVPSFIQPSSSHRPAPIVDNRAVKRAADKSHEMAKKRMMEAQGAAPKGNYPLKMKTAAEIKLELADSEMNH